MENTLNVLPDFTIIAENTSSINYDFFGILRCYALLVEKGKHVETYKITPSSFWKGMNFCTTENFIDLLKANSKNEIPSNVLVELNNFVAKFGVVTLLGEDVIKISDPDVLKEVHNNEHLKKCIYKIEDNLVFIKHTSLKSIFDLFENEIGYPIKIHRSSMPTYLIEIYNEQTDSELCTSTKAINQVYALKNLYDLHVTKPPYKLKFFSKAELQEHMNTASEPTEEDILRYMKYLYENRKELNLFLFVRQIETSLSAYSPRGTNGRTYW